MVNLSRAFFILLIIVFLGGCRDVFDDPGMEVDLSIENLLTPHPDGGCPEGTVDPYDNSDSPQIGGDVAVKIEMSAATDFRCPYCAMFAVRAAAIFEQPEYRDYVRFYYHHYPLGSHEDALEAHMRAYAVYKQSESKFWRLHDQIFESAEAGDTMSLSDIDDWVEAELDVDMDLYEVDKGSQETEEAVLLDKGQASNMGINSVPRLIICGQMVQSWNNFEAILDHYLGY